MLLWDLASVVRQLVHITLVYYLICLVIGMSSMVSVSVTTIKTRHPFFRHYLVFSAFYTLLMAVLTASLYMEANLPPFFASAAAALRLAIFLSKAGLACALVALASSVFDIPGRKRIDLVVFLLALLAVALRLVSFFEIIPEDLDAGTTFPLSRIVVDGLLILTLLYVVVLRLFRLEAVIPEDLRRLLRSVTLVLAVFAPVLILEVLFHAQWKFVPFSPALYSSVSLMFAVRLAAHFAGNYRPSPQGRGMLANRNDPGFVDFVRRYGLSRREEEVVLHLLCGETNTAIADKLFIAPSTVKAHIYNIFRKSSVKTRHQLFFRILNPQ